MVTCGGPCYTCHRPADKDGRTFSLALDLGNAQCAPTPAIGFLERVLSLLLAGSGVGGLWSHAEEPSLGSCPPGAGGSPLGDSVQLPAHGRQSGCSQTLDCRY